MDHHRNSRRPQTSIGYRRPKMNHFPNHEDPARYNFSQKYGLQGRGRNPTHPQDYQNVKVFNLNPGCQFIRSSEKLFVKINDQQFTNAPKSLSEKTLKPAQMESLIIDLKEQVSTLSNYLEEERLRHGSTKKKASLDLQNQEKSNVEDHNLQLEKLYQKHENEKIEISQLHKKALLEFEQEWKHKYEQLKTEYRMLQASFKNYRLTLQEEKREEWRLLKEELNWEKRREIENAIDDCKKEMEENFASERESMRREFKMNLNEVMHDHRAELEELTHKFTSGDHNLEEMKRRSVMLDDAQLELEELKTQLEDKNESLNQTQNELSQTKLDFSSLQLEFDDRVASVDDLHRSKISSLTLENADVRMRLIRSAEELHKEKYEKERAEEERREIVTKVFEEKLISHESLGSMKLGKSTKRKVSGSFSNPAVSNNNLSTSNTKPDYVRRKVSFVNSNQNSSTDLKESNSTLKCHSVEKNFDEETKENSSDLMRNEVTANVSNHISNSLITAGSVKRKVSFVNSNPNSSTDSKESNSSLKSYSFKGSFDKATSENASNQMENEVTANNNVSNHRSNSLRSASNNTLSKSSTKSEYAKRKESHSNQNISNDFKDSNSTLKTHLVEGNFDEVTAKKSTDCVKNEDIAKNDGTNYISNTSRSNDTVLAGNSTIDKARSCTNTPELEHEDHTNPLYNINCESSLRSDLSSQLNDFSFDDNLVREELITEKVAMTEGVQNGSNEEEIQHPIRFSIAPIQDSQDASEKGPNPESGTSKDNAFHSNEITEENDGEEMSYTPRGKGRPDSPDVMY